MLLSGVPQKTKGGNDVSSIKIQYAETHEIGFHVLLLQFREVGSKFLTKHVEERVSVCCRCCESRTSKKQNEQSFKELFHKDKWDLWII